MLCSVVEHTMTSLSFQTAIEAKLRSFVQFENEMASYRALSMPGVATPRCKV